MTPSADFLAESTEMERNEHILHLEPSVEIPVTVAEAEAATVPPQPLPSQEITIHSEVNVVAAPDSATKYEDISNDGDETADSNLSTSSSIPSPTMAPALDRSIEFIMKYVQYMRQSEIPNGDFRLWEKIKIQLVYSHFSCSQDDAKYCAACEPLVEAIQKWWDTVCTCSIDPQKCPVLENKANAETDNTVQQ